MILAFRVILDLTKKFNLLRYTNSKLDSCSYEEKIKRVNKACIHLLKSI